MPIATKEPNFIETLDRVLDKSIVIDCQDRVILACGDADTGQIVIAAIEVYLSQVDDAYLDRLGRYFFRPYLPDIA